MGPTQRTSQKRCCLLARPHRSSPGALGRERERRVRALREVFRLRWASEGGVEFGTGAARRSACHLLRLPIDLASAPYLSVRLRVGRIQAARDSLERGFARDRNRSAGQPGRAHVDFSFSHVIEETKQPPPPRRSHSQVTCHQGCPSGCPATGALTSARFTRGRVVVGALPLPRGPILCHLVKRCFIG